MNEQQYEEKVEKQEEKAPRRRPYMPSTAFIVILILIGMFAIYCKTLLPKQLYDQAKKDYENGKYEQALRVFNVFALIDPFDEEVISYQVKTLDKLPPTYSRQKLLYEIYDNEFIDEAKVHSSQIVQKMRDKIYLEAGDNYIESVLFQNQVMHWNSDYPPLTYYISNNVNAPDYFVNAIRSGFSDWTKATSNLVTFKEIENKGQANILVTLTNSVPESVKEYYKKYQVGNTVPVISNDVLKQMQIYLKVKDTYGSYFREDEISTVALHEIGHSLGIWGHSSKPEDLMYYLADNIVPGKSKQITGRDVNTLNLLYKLVPDTTNVKYTAAQTEKMYYHYLFTQDYGRNFEYEIRRIMLELEANRNDISKWVELAIAYAEDKRYEQSNVILFKAFPLIDRNFNNMQVIYYNIAANYYNLRNYKMSKVYLDKAKRLKNDVDIKTLEAFIRFREGKYHQAEPILRDLFDSDPSNIEIAIKLAYIYKKDGQKNEVDDVLVKLVNANPKAKYDRRVARYKVGKIYLNLLSGAV